jgi:hypothetical protein
MILSISFLGNSFRFVLHRFPFLVRVWQMFVRHQTARADHATLRACALANFLTPILQCISRQLFPFFHDLCAPGKPPFPFFADLCAPGKPLHGNRSAMTHLGLCEIFKFLFLECAKFEVSVFDFAKF